MSADGVGGGAVVGGRRGGVGGPLGGVNGGATTTGVVVRLRCTLSPQLSCEKLVRFHQPWRLVPVGILPKA